MSRNIKFDDYSRDLNLLLSSNSEFIKTQKEFFKTSVLISIEDLYDKIDSQDRKIKSIVDNITFELSFDIDILITQTQRLIDELELLSSATFSVRNTLNQVVLDIDEEIDRCAKELLFHMEIYIQNIQNYCSCASEILTMSRLKKRQNRKLLNLANLIYSDRTELLEEFLSLNQNTLLTNSNQKIYASYDDEKRILRDIQSFLNTSLKKEKPKKIKIKARKEEKIPFLDLDLIVEDLNLNGCDDLFYFLQTHKESKEYFEKFHSKELLEEVFVSFLTLVIPSNPHLMFLDNEFNQDNIRIVKWKSNQEIS
jgi:hypothetical protein